MANVLSNDRKQQLLADGRLGWPLRPIERATGVRRETASKYPKAAGVPVRSPGLWGRRPPPKPANEVSTDSETAPPSGPPRPGRSPTSSACEPHRELVERSPRKGRNAMAIWQDLVGYQGFAHQ